MRWTQQLAGSVEANGRSLVGMAGAIILLLALGWGTFFFLVLPGEYVMGDHAVFGLGLALTAFTLGVLHAFDADHIAAIDNTTRKQVTDGSRPVSVGFWSALGHSSVVIVAVTLLAAGLNVLAEQISAEDSTFTSMAGLWGVLVSGIFLRGRWRHISKPARMGRAMSTGPRTTSTSDYGIAVR